MMKRCSTTSAKHSKLVLSHRTWSSKSLILRVRSLVLLSPWCWISRAVLCRYWSRALGGFKPYFLRKSTTCHQGLGTDCCCIRMCLQKTEIYLWFVYAACKQISDVQWCDGSVAAWPCHNGTHSCIVGTSLATARADDHAYTHSLALVDQTGNVNSTIYK